MSDFSVKKFPDEPIVLVSVYSSVRLENTDVYQENTRQILELFDSLKEPIYYIYDLTDAKLDLAQVIVGANKGAGSASGSLRHPIVKEVVIVTQSNLIKLAAKGLKSAVFGSVVVSVFDTLDEALAYARTQIAEK